MKKFIPIIENKAPGEPSVFLPENLLREARRQKDIPEGNVPEVCVLDPDGDLSDYLMEKGHARINRFWACFHSYMYKAHLGSVEVGIIPRIVGAPYAVMVAEQLFVSGCKWLISISSAGIISQPFSDKNFALITEAIRDEGTSYHYLSKEDRAIIPAGIYEKLNHQKATDSQYWFDAISWTTDAPYRETKTAISAMQDVGVTCVEMEASALYALARAKNKAIICFAHITNTMAQQHGDFEKGEHSGSLATLELLKDVIRKI
ncbi:MAG: nucleoside phosphorylase [Bacteroidota bacterium]